MQAHPHDPEIVIRLGFNLWLAVVEANRIGLKLPIDAYAKQFVWLFRQYESELRNNADFCWAFGLGIELFWFSFPGMTEEEGKAWTARACARDAFGPDFMMAGPLKARLSLVLRVEEPLRNTMSSTTGSGLSAEAASGSS